METNSSDLENAILLWFQKISFMKNKIESLEDLKNGLFLLEILQLIDDDKKCLDSKQIIQDVGDDWSLQLQNLTLLIESLQNYYSHYLHTTIEQEIEPISILNDLDYQSLIQLIKVILVAIINSQEREQFLQSMLLLQDENLEKIILQFVMDAEGKLNQIENNNKGNKNSENHKNELQIQKKDSINNRNSNESDLQQKDEQFLIQLEINNNRLQNELRLSKQENQELQNQIKQYQDTIDQKEDQILKINLENSEQLQKMGVNDLEEIQSEITSKNLKIQQLQNHLNEVKADNKQKNEDLQEQIQEVQNYKEKGDEYKKLIKKLNQQISDLQMKIQAHENQEKRLNETISEKEKNNDTSDSKFQKLKAKLDKEKQECVSLQVELQKKDYQIEKQNEQLIQLNEQKQEYKENIARLNDQIDLLKNEIQKDSENSHMSSPCTDNRQQETLFNELKASEFKEYLGVLNTQESPRNGQIFNLHEMDHLPINSLGSKEETQRSEEEEKNNKNNQKRRGSEIKILQEEYEDLKQENQMYQEKVKELVIEIQALQTTLNAQDNQNLQNNNQDDRQGLIKSNEALTELLKKKSGIIQNISKRQINLELMAKQFENDKKELEKLRKVKQSFNKQIIMVKQECQEKEKQYEEEIKLLVSILHSLQQQLQVKAQIKQQ